MALFIAAKYPDHSIASGGEFLRIPCITEITAVRVQEVGGELLRFPDGIGRAGAGCKNLHAKRYTEVSGTRCFPRKRI